MGQVLSDYDVMASPKGLHGFALTKIHEIREEWERREPPLFDEKAVEAP